MIYKGHVHGWLHMAVTRITNRKEGSMHGAVQPRRLPLYPYYGFGGHDNAHATIDAILTTEPTNKLPLRILIPTPVAIRDTISYIDIAAIVRGHQL